MNKLLLILTILTLALPSFAQDVSREKLAEYAEIEAKDLAILEGLYDLTVIRASNLDCFSKKPDIFDRTRRNKRYKKYKRGRKINDLCRVEYIRIELAADNLDEFNDIKIRRKNAGSTLFNKVSLTRHAVVSDINERKERMRDLSCHIQSSNANICDAEEDAIEYITKSLLPVVNKQMKNIWGYECRGTGFCR